MNRNKIKLAKVVMISLFIMLSTVLAFSQSAKKLSSEAFDYYRNGDYPQTVLLYIKALNKKPKHKEILEMAGLAIPAAISNLENEIYQKKEISSTFKGKESVKLKAEIVKKYISLCEIESEFQSMPRVSQKRIMEQIHLKFKDYTTLLLEARYNMTASMITFFHENLDENSRRPGNPETSVSCNSFKFYPGF